MIHLLFLLLLQAPNAKQLPDGNYITVKPIGKPTGKTIKDGEKVYQVFISDKGKLYYEVVSKSGKVYRKYIKIDQ